MKKVFVSLLLVFFLSFSASSSAADMKETISYAAGLTGVSAELLKALSTSQAKLLGKLGDTLSVISIGQQFYEADDKGVILSILNLAAGKLIDKFCPSATPFIAGYNFYLASLEVVHNAFWIPTLSDEIYKAYEKQRKQRVIPNEVYIHHLLEPIRADLKAKLISGKYDKESITDWSGEIIPKWQEKIDKETNKILTALLEERYQKKILPELIAEAKKVAEQRQEELIEKLKDRLYVQVSGTVVKKTEDGTEVVPAAKICVKGKRHCTYSMGNGYFEMKVPYRLLNGDSFQLVCSKGEKTVTSPTIDFLGKLRRRFNINLGKLEEEEEEEELEYQLPFTEEEINSMIEDCTKEAEGKLGIQLSSLTKQYIAGHVRFVVYLYRKYDFSHYVASLPWTKRGGSYEEAYEKKGKELDEIYERHLEGEFGRVRQKFSELYDFGGATCEQAKSTGIPFSSCAGWIAYRDDFVFYHNDRAEKELEQLTKGDEGFSDKWPGMVVEQGDTPEARQIFIEANKYFAYRLSWKEKETFIHLEFECIHRPYGEKLCEK